MPICTVTQSTYNVMAVTYATTFFPNQFATFDYVGHMSKSTLCNFVGRLK